MTSDNLKLQMEQHGEPFKAISYSTPEACMGAMDGDPQFASMDEHGDVDDYPLDKVMEGIKNVGVWGWTEGRIIHFWADPRKVTYRSMCFFFGHEIGHYMPSMADVHGNGHDEVRVFEEHVCDGYAFAAAQAGMLAREYKSNIWAYGGDWVGELEGGFDEREHCSTQRKL
jgi:hypothetical protein